MSAHETGCIIPADLAVSQWIPKRLQLAVRQIQKLFILHVLFGSLVEHWVSYRCIRIKGKWRLTLGIPLLLLVALLVPTPVNASDSGKEDACEDEKGEHGVLCCLHVGMSAVGSLV
jgi:hypothetical protein